MDKYIDHNGNEIRIGKKIGGGGEATVYSVEGNNNIVAKIYNDEHPIDSQKLSKLEKMCDFFDNKKIAEYYAWPQEVIYLDDKPVGFIMENINKQNLANSKYIKVINFYNLRDRKKHFPNLEYKYMVHAALNFVKAIDTLHEQGIVIGDINESNIFVNNSDATVKLIDCDSYQFKQFLCDVGKPEYTAPELPSKLRGVERTKNHDYFAMAIIIFQMLVWVHPYKDAIHRESIQQGLYCYGKDAESKNIHPLYPYSEVFNSLNNDIKDLFEQAFTSIKRPTTKVWIYALEKYENELVQQCKKNPPHYHLSSKSCVWCELEEKSNFYAFGKSPANQIFQKTTSKNIQQTPYPNTQQNKVNYTSTSSLNSSYKSPYLNPNKSQQVQTPQTNNGLKYFVIIVVIIFLSVIISSNSQKNKNSIQRPVPKSTENITNQNTDYDVVNNYEENEEQNINDDPINYSNENEDQYSTRCEADSTLKALKKMRTKEFASLLNNSRYIFNLNYSLWYRNTIDETGEGSCYTDEMIKNLFWSDPSVYLVHRINYGLHKENDNIVISQFGYDGLDNLFRNSDFYRGNTKLSSKEINTLLENSLLDRNNENNSNYSQPKQNTDKPIAKVSREQLNSTETSSKSMSTKKTNPNKNYQYSKSQTTLEPQKPVGNENDFFE